MRTRGGTAFAGLGFAGWLILTLGAMPVQLSECTGTVSSGKCGSPSPDNLHCLGQCQQGSSCDTDEFEDGETTYAACACVGAQGSTEPSCCHVIAISQGGGSWSWGAGGTCPSCGTTGGCNFVTSGGSCQAQCGG